MKKNLALVTIADTKKPVFYNNKENVFCWFDSTDYKFKPVEEALIVEDDSICCSVKSAFEIIIRKRLSENNLPSDVAFDIYKNKGQSYLHAYLYEKFNDPDSCCYQSIRRSDVKVAKKELDKIREVVDSLSPYLGFLNNVHARGQSVRPEIIIKIIGAYRTVTADSLRDGHAKDELNPKFWLGDSISWVIKEEKLYGIVKRFHLDNFEVVTSDGRRKFVLYDNSTITKENKIPNKRVTGNKLTKTISENFVKSFDSLKLYKAKVKIQKVDEPYLSGGNVIEAKCASCPNCNILMREKTDNFFSCIMCSQAARMVHQEGNIGIFILGDIPKKFSFCFEEAKCCGNCGLSHFYHNSGGFKKEVGSCEFTSQIIQSHNICEHWIPLAPTEFERNMKKNSTNLSFILKDKHNAVKQRGIENTVYDRLDYSTRSKAMMDLANSYGLTYLEWTKKIIEKAKNLPIVDI